MNVCLFEDSRYKNFLPLVYFRPVFDLFCGPLSLRQSIALALPKQKFTLLVRPELADLVAEDNPGLTINACTDHDSWFINGRLIMNADIAKRFTKPLKQSKIFLSNGELAVLFLCKKDIHRYRSLITKGLLDKEMFADIPSESLECGMVQYPWDLVYRTSEEITNLFTTLRKKSSKGKATICKGVSFVNRKNILIGSGSVVKPGVVLDAETVGSRLAVRNLMDELRGSGLETGGPATYSAKNRQDFANQLDRLLTRLLREAAKRK